MAIQDRSFNTDGSLFYPDNRAFFEGLDPDQLQIPFSGEEGVGGRLGHLPHLEPGVLRKHHGRQWQDLAILGGRGEALPFPPAERLQGRFLILKTDVPVTFWQIGSREGIPTRNRCSRPRSSSARPRGPT